MRVRLNRSFCGLGERGDIIEVDGMLGRSWVQKGYAAPVADKMMRPGAVKGDDLCEPQQQLALPR